MGCSARPRASWIGLWIAAEGPRAAIAVEGPVELQFKGGMIAVVGPYE
jgi:hypothetical protein